MKKGTVGLLVNQENMPYTKDGIIPDIIMNPHAIPSRMTIAQLVECVMGKNASLAGYEADATPFTGVEVEDIQDILLENGYEKSGTEILYDGRTGEQIEAKIFIGPTFYYRLKHLVQEKIHSRSTGPYQLLTRQPAEGRSRDGGLRLTTLQPQWEQKLLLVCSIAGDIAKFMQSLKVIIIMMKFLIPSCYRNIIVALGNSQRYGNKLRIYKTSLIQIPTFQ